MPWTDRAACVGHDPELFFPVAESGPALRQIAEAKAVCARCPVLDACLDWSLRTRQAEGIWGGRTGTERRAMEGFRKPAKTRTGAVG